MAKIKDLTTSDFFNREEYLEKFEAFLAGDGKPIMVLQGIAGVGKTALLRQLHRACIDDNHLCIFIDWAGVSKNQVSILIELYEQLVRQGGRGSKKFFKAFSVITSRYLKLHTELHHGEAQGRKEIAVGVMDTVVFALKELLKPIPFAAPILDITSSTYANVVSVFERLPQSDKDLLLDPVRHLTEKFCKAVNKLSQSVQPDRKVVFLFDSLEKLEQNNVDQKIDWEVWLRDDLISETEGVLFVLATRNKDTLQRWSVSGSYWQRVIDCVTVLEYSPEAAKLYLSAHNITDSRLVESILTITHRHPLALDLIIEWTRRDPLLQGIDLGGEPKQMDIQQHVFGFTGDLLGYLLDEDCDPAVSKAAILRSFNGDALKSVVGKDCLDDIKKYSFVIRNYQTGYYRYHDLVRDALNNRLRSEYYGEYIELHQKSIRYYTQLLEKALNVQRWEFALIESIYHRMIVDEEDGLKFVDDMFERIREAFRLDLCSGIIDEVSRLARTPEGQQRVRFLEGKLLHTQNYFDAAARLLRRILHEHELLSESLKFETEVTLGEVLYLKGDNVEAFTVLQRAVDLTDEAQDRYPRVSGHAHWHLGRICRSQGKMDLAIGHLERSNELLVKTGQNYLAGYALCTLGEVYQMQGKYAQATKSLAESINLLREGGSRSIYGRSMHILGRVFQFQGKWEEAKSLLEASLRIRREVAQEKPQHSLGFAYWGLGWFYLCQRNAEEAFKYLNKSLGIFEAIDGRDGIARTYRLMAEAYLLQEEFKKASDLFEEAIPIQESRQGNYELGSLYLGLTRCNIALENWEGALKTNTKAKKFTKITDNQRGQVEAEIYEIALKMYTGQKESLESSLTQVQQRVQCLNYPSLVFEVELLQAEYALDIGELGSSVRAYKRAYEMAKAFHESYALYVAKRIGKKLQSISGERANCILAALSEVLKDHADNLNSQRE